MYGMQHHPFTSTTTTTSSSHTSDGGATSMDGAPTNFVKNPNGTYQFQSPPANTSGFDNPTKGVVSYVNGVATCSCGVQCLERTVTADTANKGKEFYACGLSSRENRGCGAFEFKPTPNVGGTDSEFTRQEMQQMHVKLDNILAKMDTLFVRVNALESSHQTLLVSNFITLMLYIYILLCVREF